MVGTHPQPSPRRHLAPLAAALLAGAAGAAFPAAPPALAGSWEGTLALGRESVRVAFTFGERDGRVTAALTSRGLGVYGLPAESVRLEGMRLVVLAPRLDIEFAGTLRLDGSGSKVVRIDGNWFQHSEMVPVALSPVDGPSF